MNWILAVTPATRGPANASCSAVCNGFGCGTGPDEDVAATAIATPTASTPISDNRTKTSRRVGALRKKANTKTFL
ncbi:MAG TPA: hypothetical protein VGI50_19485 [Solirubrobacteraceae bacterium]